MSAIEIRRAKPKELDEVIALVKPMWVMHGTEEPTLLNRAYLEKYDAKLYFTPCFDKPEKNALYVAIEGQTIVGCCRAEVVELEGMFHEKTAVYVDDLVVKESHQRQGIGNKLLEEVESFTRKAGIKLLKTRVYAFDTSAQAIFNGKDFKPVYSESYKKL